MNRELRTLPRHVQDCASAELAREVARDFDAGERAAASRLQRLLADLRKMAAPVAGAEQPVTPEAPDELDEIRRARADRVAEAAGVVRAIGADDRRAGSGRSR